MIRLKLEEGILKANWYPICNLRRPYRRSIDVVKSRWRSHTGSYIARTPNEVMNLGTSHRYRFRTSSGHYHALIPTSKGHLRTNCIYSTKKKCASRMVANSLVQLFNTLDSDDHYIVEIRALLEKVVAKVVASYDFDVIISDLPDPLLLIPQKVADSVTVIPANFSMVKQYPDPEFRSTNAILRYHEKLPLRLLHTHNFLKLPEENTDIDFRAMHKDARVLVLSGMNPMYAGYLANTLRANYKVKDVLPVGIFRIQFNTNL